MKLLPVLSAIFCFVGSTMASSQELTTITTGDEELPMSVAWIIYSRVDPGTTKEIFRRDNPHLESYGWEDELPAFTEFFAPVGDREEILEAGSSRDPEGDESETCHEPSSTSRDDENVQTIEMPADFTAEVFLNLDGAGGPFPIMQLKPFCELNDICSPDCTLDYPLKEGTIVKYQY